MKSHEYYMKKALLLAKKAGQEGEVPVGAVIVKDDIVIATGQNRREQKQSAVWHAEIEAINKACKKLKGWHLKGCRLYVTLEPCPMCAGAIINSRISEVYIGASDKKSGAVFSVVSLFSLPFNHSPDVFTGVCEGECTDILKSFFKELRKRGKRWNKNI